MNSDTLTLLGGVTLSALIAQTTPNGSDIFEMLRTLSASGVLAIVFWWITQRLERRLDTAFEQYKKLTETLIGMLQEKDKEDKR